MQNKNGSERANVEASSSRNRGPEDISVALTAKLIDNKTTEHIKTFSDKNHTSGLNGYTTERTVRQTRDQLRHKHKDHSRTSRKKHRTKSNRPIIVTGDDGTMRSFLFGTKMIQSGNAIHEKDRNHYVNIGMVFY